MACAKLTFSAPDTIPLDCLELSDGNVRRIKPAIPIQSLAVKPAATACKLAAVAWRPCSCS